MHHPLFNKEEPPPLMRHGGVLGIMSSVQELQEWLRLLTQADILQQQHLDSFG